MSQKLRHKSISKALLLGLCSAIFSGCAAQNVAPAVSASQPAVTAGQISPRQGLESVLGLTASQLESSFGKPRLDVVEANGRKLQFIGKACIMDVYLYPPKANKPAVATHIDARRRDGAEVDRAACVRALSR